MDKDYQDFDMTGATRGIPPQIARLQAKKLADEQQLNEMSLIEPDVWQLIRKNSNKPSEIAKINNILRLILA